MTDEISLPPFAFTPVTAVTVTRLVMSVPELVMNALDPLITHSPPSRRAVVCVAPASEPPPAEGTTGDQVRQPALLLLLRPEAVQRHRPEPDTRLQRDGHRGVHARELLERQAQCEVVAALTAPLLAEGQAEEPHLAHLGDDLVGELLLLVQLTDDGRDDLPREVLDRRAQGFVLFGQSVIHVPCAP
jgi:hypothetical protein